MKPIHTIVAGAAALALVSACHPAEQAGSQVDVGKISGAIKAGETQWSADLAAEG